MSTDRDRLMRQDEVLAICAVSKSHLYRMMAAGEFPKQVAVGRRSVRWRHCEVREWLEGLQQCQYVVVQRFRPCKWKAKMSAWLVGDGGGFA